MTSQSKHKTSRGRVRVWKQFPSSPLPVGAPDERAKVVIVGAGPVGLAMAIDLALKGHQVVVLGRYNFIADGSKAICFSKRSLDILDRLGVGEAAVARGVDWNVGKVFWQDRAEPVYQFDMLPVKNQKMPGFINLQQYLLEDMLIDRIGGLPSIDLRWGHELIEIAPEADRVIVNVSAEAGDYRITCDWLIACDGNKSTVRDQLGLSFEGQVFEDNFLIADVRMTGERPAERWFWFDPPFNPGKSVLLHKQPDNVWRIDFQLGWDIDREACVRPENVDPLIRAMLGDDVEYEEVWYSVYTFQCRRMARFIHDRVIFAGDSAHLVSPFGARGCNGGLADVDNLGWKLDLVLRGDASAELLDSYDAEATATADENILNSTRSTDFITPKSPTSAVFRDAVLDLASAFPFARQFVNSGRLSTAVSYRDGPLNSGDEGECGRGVPAGSPVLDAPFGNGWLLEHLGGRFVLVGNGYTGDVPEGIDQIDLAREPGNALAIERLGLHPGAACLVRPDQYVAARFRNPSPAAIAAAYTKATAGAFQ